MLSPLGSLVIKFDNQNVISGAKSSLEFEDEDDIWDATLHAPSPSVCENEEELDLEDLIGTPDTKGLEELTPSDLSAYLTIEVKDGTKKRVHKAHCRWGDVQCHALSTQTTQDSPSAELRRSRI